MLVAGDKPQQRSDQMSEVLSAPAHSTAAGDLPELLGSWRRHLAARRTSPATLDTYSSWVRGLDRFLASAGLPTTASELRREHIEAFITELLDQFKPATAHNGYWRCGRPVD